MIQQLIPLGLIAVEDALQSEVTRLAGGYYQRNANTIKRWGSNPGVVCLGSQKLSIAAPRASVSLKKHNVTYFKMGTKESRFKAILFIGEGEGERPVFIVRPIPSTLLIAVSSPRSHSSIPSPPRHNFIITPKGRMTRVLESLPLQS
ncbi:MAG: hypothetical protein AAB317_03715 [Nitrospirota bacterium]